MRIKLSPVFGGDTLVVVKNGSALTINGKIFDLSPMADGDTLPFGAITSTWFPTDVEHFGGELVVTLRLPNPWNYSPEQAFPVDLVDVPDGRVALPLCLPNEDGSYPELVPIPDVTGNGEIDWSKLITKAMKDAAAQAAQLAAAKSLLAEKNLQAATQIARIQDRIDTIGYGIDVGEATDEDIAEQAALVTVLTTWKAYKFALGKVTKQSGWYANPVWPVVPPIPVIIADPQTQTLQEV